MLLKFRIPNETLHGSSLVTDEGRGLDAVAIGQWCEQLAALVKDGREVIMVSSGAIAEGMKRLGWASRPKAIHELQAAAAVVLLGAIYVGVDAWAGGFGTLVEGPIEACFTPR